jgi:hypothetical protein
MKKLFLVAVIAIVTGIAVAGGVSIASANHESDGKPSAFVDSVAEILGIAPEEVSGAIAQAKSEAKVAHLEAMLADAVAAGVIDEAAAISDWLAGKPNALRSMRHHGLRSAVEAGGVEAFLAGLVDQEIITTTESAEISAWLELRPPATDRLRKWRHEQFKSGGHRFRHGGKCGRGYGGSGHHKHFDPNATPDPEVSNSNPV